MAWTEWKRMFDTYMDAIDSDLFSDKRKTALLLHSLGAEGAEIFKAERTG